MFREIGKWLKTLLWACVLICLIKVYENAGFSNPKTLSVICLIFSLWVLFRIELNEDIADEENRNNTECPPSPTSTIFTPTGSSHKNLRVEDLYDGDDRKKKRRLSKYSKLVRSRSNTPTKAGTPKIVKI